MHPAGKSRNMMNGSASGMLVGMGFINPGLWVVADKVAV
jgi:hypothetical protein